MKCREPGCDGLVNMKKEIILPKRCSRFSIIVYSCSKCGRLHGEQGSSVTAQEGKIAFWIDEKVVHKDEQLVN